MMHTHTLGCRTLYLVIPWAVFFPLVCGNPSFTHSVVNCTVAMLIFILKVVLAFSVRYRKYIIILIWHKYQVKNSQNPEHVYIIFNFSFRYPYCSLPGSYLRRGSNKYPAIPEGRYCFLFACNHCNPDEIVTCLVRKRSPVLVSLLA